MQVRQLSNTTSASTPSDPDSSLLGGPGDPDRRDPFVLVTRLNTLGYPEHANGSNADYLRLSDALTRVHTDDLFVVQYSLPDTPHRLAGDAALDLGPSMVVVLFDQDAPKEHRRDGRATPEWYAAQQPLLERLLAKHPGAFIYRTRGGNRIIYLISPVTLRTRADKACWSATYRGALTYLREEFGIVCDPKCADWPHLFRLPHVVRDGEPTCPEPIVGDPSAIGLWDWEWDPSAFEVANVRMSSVANGNSAPIEKVEEAVRVLGAAWPATGRNSAHLALAGGLARAGWPAEHIAAFMHDVAEVEEPGNGDIVKRTRDANATVSKLAAGANVVGFPTLADLIGGELVDEVCAFLQISRPPKADPDFADKLTRGFREKAAARAAEESPPPPPPTADRVRAHLESARDKLKRATDANKRLAGVLLGKVLTPREFVKDVPALCEAVEAVVQNVPPGTTPTQISEVLLSFAGRFAPELDEMIGDAIDASSGADAIAELELGRDGKPQASLENLDIALRQFSVSMYYDEFSRRQIFERDNVREVLRDDHVICLRIDVGRELKFLPSVELLRHVLEHRARANPYHPVRDYLASVEATWDGVPRLERWLIDAGGEDTPYVRAVSQIVLVAAVRRVRSPGCKFDEMLILESPQGHEKSSAIQVLGGLWYGAGVPLGADAQVTIERTSGSWIVESPELRGMSQRAHHELKEWLSQPEDKARKAYGHETETVPRQFVVIGTTNDDKYFYDTTGNRRYWPVKIKKFDLAKLRAERDQLFAEAAVLESTGTSIRLDPELWPFAAEEQEDRRHVDVFELQLGMKLGTREGRLLCLDALRLLGLERPTPAEQTRLGAAMRTLGWERRRVKEGGLLKYAYVKGDGRDWIAVGLSGDIVSNGHPLRLH